MKRVPMPPRKARMARGPIARKPRKASEFRRVYGSRARVRWVKSLPCVACLAVSPIFGAISAGQSQNAHTVTGGMGRKAGSETIVPLCASHHRCYDQHQPPFDTPAARQAVIDAAAVVETAWQAHAA